MKNLFYLLVIAICFLACNSMTPQEKAAKAKADSLKKDSMYVANGGHIDCYLCTEQQKKDFQKNKKENQKKADSLKKVKDAKQKVIDAANQKAFEKTPIGRMQKLHPTWTTQECQDLLDRKIWIGMTLDMLKYNRGIPNTVNVSNYGDGNQYQWCWDDFTPSCFYGGVDGVVTSYN